MDQDNKELMPFRKDYIDDNVEIQLGHIPSYNTEKESELIVFNEIKKDE